MVVFVCVVGMVTPWTCVYSPDPAIVAPFLVAAAGGGCSRPLGLLSRGTVVSRPS